MVVKKLLKIRKPSRFKQRVMVDDGTSLELQYFELVDDEFIVDEVVELKDYEYDPHHIASTAPVDFYKPPVVVCFPAMGVPSSYYRLLAAQLNAQHCIAVTCDLRGMGSSSVRASKTNDFSFYDMVCHDFPAVLASVRARYPDHPVNLLGHSLGGQLALLYAAYNQSLEAQQSQALNGLILIASGSVYYKSYAFPANLKTLLGTQLAWGSAKVLGTYYGDKFSFGGRQPYSLIKDWAYQARTGEYRLAHTAIDFEALLAQLNMPILAISIAGDWLAPVAAAEHLCEKTPSSPVDYWLYDSPEVDHFNWVRNSAELVLKCADWMTRSHRRMQFEEA